MGAAFGVICYAVCHRRGGRHRPKTLSNTSKVPVNPSDCWGLQRVGGYAPHNRRVVSVQHFYKRFVAVFSFVPLVCVQQSHREMQGRDFRFFHRNIAFCFLTVAFVSFYFPSFDTVSSVRKNKREGPVYEPSRGMFVISRCTAVRGRQHDLKVSRLL